MAYYFGADIPKDFIQAYEWLNLAAANGDKKSADMREKLVASMTPDQIAEGKKRVAAFVPKITSRGSK